MWGERLRIGLAGGSVELARLSPFGGRVREEKRFNFRSASVRPVTQKILLALPRALEQMDIGRGEAAVVLSNELVRYAMLPWQDAVSAPQDVRALARLQFEQIHGEAARGWTVQCHEGGWGQPTLACAIDTTLLEGLQAVLAARRMKLASVQPLLMAAFNAVRGDLAADATLAVVEPQRLCLSVLRGGRPVSVVSRFASGDSASVAAQELAMLGEPDAVARPIDVIAVGALSRWVFAGRDGSVVPAPGSWRAHEAAPPQVHCALACTGVA
jgi:hypothetical protein